MKFEGLDAIEKEILDARCAVLIRDPAGAVDHLAKAIELLRQQWDEKYGSHLPPPNIKVDAIYGPRPALWGESVNTVTGKRLAEEAANLRAAGMMNAIQPSHEEKVRAVFRDLRQASKDLVRFERIVYGVPGEDDPPHGEGDRTRLAAEHDGIKKLLRRLGELEPKARPAAQLGENVTKLLRALEKRREAVQEHRHGFGHLYLVVDWEREVDSFLRVITNSVAYDWGEHRPAPIKRSLIERLFHREKQPWYMRFTSHPW